MDRNRFQNVYGHPETITKLNASRIFLSRTKQIRPPSFRDLDLSLHILQAATETLSRKISVG